MLFPRFVAWIWYLPYLSHTLIIQPAIDFKDFVGPQGSKAGKCREYTPPLTSPCFLFWPCFSSLFSFQLLTHFTLLLFLAASVGPFCFPMTISSAREKQDDIYVSFLAIHSMLPVWEVLKQWEMHQDNGALPPFEHNIYIHLLEMCTHMGFWMICRSLKNRKDGKMECAVFLCFFLSTSGGESADRQLWQPCRDLLLSMINTSGHSSYGDFLWGEKNNISWSPST